MDVKTCVREVREAYQAVDEREDREEAALVPDDDRPSRVRGPVGR